MHYLAVARIEAMKASHRISHQDKASTCPRESTVMLAVSRKLNIRLDRHASACEGFTIQDLHVGTRPFQPDAPTFEVTYWNQKIVDSGIPGIFMEPSTKVLEEADAAVLEVWPNAANELIQEGTGHRVLSACTEKAHNASLGVVPCGEGLGHRALQT